jgi:hypothetical protein
MFPELLDPKLIIDSCLQFNVNGMNYHEFICYLEMRDLLAVKNWILDKQESGTHEFKVMTQEDAIKDGFISVTVTHFDLPITIYLKKSLGVNSFIGPVTKLLHETTKNNVPNQTL